MTGMSNAGKSLKQNGERDVPRWGMGCRRVGVGAGGGGAWATGVVEELPSGQGWTHPQR